MLIYKNLNINNAHLIRIIIIDIINNRIDFDMNFINIFFFIELNNINGSSPLISIC